VNIYRTLQNLDKYNDIIDKLAKAPSHKKEYEQAVKILNNSEIDEVDKTLAFLLHTTSIFLRLRKVIWHLRGF